MENQVQKFPGRTKIADFRKNAEDWKHCFLAQCVTFDWLPSFHKFEVRWCRDPRNNKVDMANSALKAFQSYYAITSLCNEIRFLSYLVIGTCIFSASQIGRQEIL